MIIKRGIDMIATDSALLWKFPEAIEKHSEEIIVNLGMLKRDVGYTIDYNKNEITLLNNENGDIPRCNYKVKE